MVKACLTHVSNIGDRDYLLPEDYKISRKNGIKDKTVQSRVYEYGWDVARAITERPKQYHSFEPIWEKWREVAISNGIHRDLFYDRVRMQGISEEEAATRPLSKGGRPSTRWTDEERDLMAKNGINPNIVNTRVTVLGWTEDEALNTPKVSEKERAERVRLGTRKYHERRKRNDGIGNQFNAFGK